MVVHTKLTDYLSSLHLQDACMAFMPWPQIYMGKSGLQIFEALRVCMYLYLLYVLEGA